MRMRTLMLFGSFGMACCSFDGSSPNDLADASPSPDAEVVYPYVSYWSFDDDAQDRTGAHDGTFVGTAAISSNGSGFGGGEALLLSQDGDRVDLGNPTAFDFNGDFTWHLYFKTADNSGALLSRNPLASRCRLT